MTKAAPACTGSPTGVAIVTPSHLGDLDRCRLLVESVRTFCRIPACHYVVVSRREHAAFAPLASSNTRLLELESLLPETLRPDPRHRDRWISATNRPISGWVIQQLAKLAFAAQTTEDVIMCVDSDTFFVRPFDLAPFVRDSEVRLFRVPGFHHAEYATWTDTANELLGIPSHPPGAVRPNYVGNLITWRQAQLPALRRRVEETIGRPWLEALGDRSQFSEYVLYGEFVDRAIQGATGHFHDTAPLCHEHWTPTNMSDRELEVFFEALEPEHIAVMISAKSSIDPRRFRGLLHRFGLAQGWDFRSRG